MSSAKPARLWLRPAAGDREEIWVILDRGKQHSTGCISSARIQAEAKLVEYLAAKHDPSQLSKRRADQTRVSDVLSVYLDEMVPKKANPVKTMARVIRLEEWWGDKLLSGVTPTTCEAYVKYRNRADRLVRTRKKKDGTSTEMVVKAKTTRAGGGARRDLEDLRSAINYHAKRELHSGIVEVTLPQKGKPRTKYMTRDEIARMLWVCWRHKREQIPPRGDRRGQRIESKSFYDMRHVSRFILVGVYTGSRTTPILRASFFSGNGRAHLDLDAELYHRLPEDMVEAENKKSPTSRISPRLLAHLRRWREIDRPSTGFVVEWNGKPVMSVKTAWRRARTLAKVDGNPTPHTLRHTAVTWLKQEGVSSFDVAGFTGMSEQMVERVYGKHDPEFQKDVARKIGYRKQKPKVVKTPLPLPLP